MSVAVWAQLAAILAVVTAMLGALLALGSHVVTDGSSARERLRWFGLIAVTLAGALGAALLALLLNSIA